MTFVKLINWVLMDGKLLQDTPDGNYWKLFGDTFLVVQEYFLDELSQDEYSHIII